MGAVLVAKDDHLLLNKGYGEASLEWNIPNAPDTKFRIGSVTKQFTATLILMLQQDGKLKINDPVAKYLGGIIIQFQLCVASWGECEVDSLGLNVIYAAQTIVELRSFIGIVKKIHNSKTIVKCMAPQQNKWVAPCKKSTTIVNPRDAPVSGLSIPL